MLISSIFCVNQQDGLDLLCTLQSWPRNDNESGVTVPPPGLNFQGQELIQAEMVKAFLVSTEYRQRFGP